MSQSAGPSLTRHRRQISKIQALQHTLIAINTTGYGSDRHNMVHTQALQQEDTIAAQQKEVERGKLGGIRTHNLVQVWLCNRKAGKLLGRQQLRQPGWG